IDRKKKLREIGAFFFGEEMNQQSFAVNPVNGTASPHELFALTDEQILDIEPEALNATEGIAPSVISSEARTSHLDADSASRNLSSMDTPDATDKSKRDSSSRLPAAPRNDGIAVAPAEPPAWLARQMKDPWAGEEARALWDDVLRAQTEAAEFRAAIATPAEAKSLKEIYPGGIEQARAAAQRPRALDEFDAAYFGVAGKPVEETAAARAALAQRMLREDPTAFREMVFAGLKALEELNVAPPFKAASSATANQDAGLKPGA